MPTSALLVGSLEDCLQVIINQRVSAKPVKYFVWHADNIISEIVGNAILHYPTYSARLELVCIHFLRISGGIETCKNLY